MPFYEALAKVINAGVPMRRECWPEGEYIIHTYIMRCRVFKGNDKELKVWSPNEEELVSNDWKVYTGKIF